MPPDSEPGGRALAALRVAELEPNPDGTSRIRIDWSELGPSDGFEPGGSDDIALAAGGSMVVPRRCMSMEELTAYCRARLVSFKVPAVIHYVTDDE